MPRGLRAAGAACPAAVLAKLACMDPGNLLAPRDPDLRRIALELHAAHADLQRSFPDPDGPDYAAWLGSHGVLGDARVAAHYPPVPPAALRMTACGGTTEGSHLWTGAADFRTVAELFEVFTGRSFTSLRSVFDFGCGCGRLLRWFRTALPDCRRLGADVRRASIDWCRTHLDGTFVANGTEPPLDLPAHSADLTVALSVFSHLSRPQFTAWMRELVRVTRPDGLILASTHGPFALAVTMRSRDHQSGLQIPADEAPGLLRTLCQDGFVHRVSTADRHELADGVAPDYGETFVTEPRTRALWSPFADVVGCVPVALHLLQDVYALRPRPVTDGPVTGGPAPVGAT
jgi:SAM-dependent methyltransferase